MPGATGCVPVESGEPTGAATRPPGAQWPCSMAERQSLGNPSGKSTTPRREAIDVKVVVQFIMRIDQAARLAIGSRERWETGFRVVERTGDQLRVRRPFQRSGWRALAAR
jgi:hypothetical protein